MKAEEVLGPKGTAQERRLKVLVWSVGLLATLAFLWILYRTVWVTMPVTAAFFIAIGVWPITDWIQRRVPRRLRGLGYLVAMAVILLVLALFFFGLWYAASTVADQWPRYDDRFQAWWSKLSGWIASLSDGGDPSGGGSGGEAAGQGSAVNLSFIADYATMLVRSIWEVLAVLGLIFFLVLFMLMEGRAWYAKLQGATDDSRTGTWLQIVDEVARRFRWYLLVRSLVGLLTGFLYGVWLWLWDVDFLVVWVLLAFLLNFVPTLGSLVAGVSAAAFAFLQKDPATALAVSLGILAIEQVTGNYLDPLLQGRQLSVSPLVVMFMLLVWTWIWGLAGALLALPLTVLIMLVFARFPALAPIALLISGETSREALARQVDRH